MKIEVCGYFITTDERNIIVSREVRPQKKGGNPYMHVEGYFPSLQSFADWFLQKRIRQSEARTIEELKLDHLAAVQELETRLSEISREVAGGD